MKRIERNFFLLGILLQLGVMFSPFGTATLAADRPNIVFFLIDDLGRSDVGFMGGKEIRTPNIDRLANGGAVLESHYVQPVCSPTRAALMTGRYAVRTGVYTIVRPHAKWGLPLEERTLANALHDAGYETAICGKWHLGEFEKAYQPTSRGFDHQYGHFFGALDYFTHLRDGSKDWYRNDRPIDEEGYTTELVAREACVRIQERDPSKPLFLYVPFNGVHSPMQVPEKYLEPYSELKGNRRILAGMLSAVDMGIGKIVEAIQKAGIQENTLIVFSSDNGGPNPVQLSDNGPLRAGKGTLYEGGVRVCAFAHWPKKIMAGTRIQEPMHIIDWYPTLVKQGGGSLSQKLPLDGKDVWPMLTSGAPSPHEEILLVQSPKRAALRMGNWKLIALGEEADEPASTQNQNNGRKRNPVQRNSGSVELYDLAKDLGESKDLAEQEPARVAAMQNKLRAYLENAVVPGGIANP